MTGMRCAVYNCNNSHRVTKARGEKTIYHAFPKERDLVSMTMRRKWVQCCGRADKFNPDTSRICSAHFTINDYERDLRNELLGLPSRKVLKKTAVPTTNLPEDRLTNDDVPELFRQEMCLKRKAQEESNMLLKVQITSANMPVRDLKNKIISEPECIKEVLLGSRLHEGMDELLSKNSSVTSSLDHSSNSQSHIYIDHIPLTACNDTLEKCNKPRMENIKSKENDET